MSKIITFLVLSIFLSACAAMPASTVTPEPASTPTSLATSSCTPPSDWEIELNRTGGIGGFDQMLTLDSNGNLIINSERPRAEVETTLSASEIEQVTNLLVEACPFEPTRDQGACADCFMYSLEIRMDTRFYSVQATDVTLTPELQALMDALSQHIQSSTTK